MSRALILNSKMPFRRQVCIGGVSKADLLERIQAMGIKVNSIALEIFTDEDFRTQERESTIEVVGTTVGELGLTDGGVLGQAIDAAEALGYGLCPLEFGPHLRLAYLDQQVGSVGFAATQNQAPPKSIPIIEQRPNEDESEYRGFYLRRIEGNLCLRGYKSWSGPVWQPQDMLAFTATHNAAQPLAQVADPARQAAWAALRSCLSSSARPKRLTAQVRLARTLGLAFNALRSAAQNKDTPPCIKARATAAPSSSSCLPHRQWPLCAIARCAGGSEGPGSTSSSER